MKKLTKLDTASVIAIRDCMGAKKNEKILVITDEHKREIGYSLFENAKRLGYKSLLVEMQSAKINGEEPSKEVADLCKNLMLYLSNCKISYTYRCKKSGFKKRSTGCNFPWYYKRNYDKRNEC